MYFRSGQMGRGEVYEGMKVEKVRHGIKVQVRTHPA